MDSGLTLYCSSRISDVAGTWLMCSLTGFLPMFCSFLATFSITCIALDRHHIILHSIIEGR